EDVRSQTAFIFFDQEEVGLLGSSLFRKQHKKICKEKLLINLDCVSDGDHFMLATTRQAREVYEVQLQEAFQPKGSKTVMFEQLESVYYPSDHARFDVALAITALKKKKNVYYMDRIHTGKDTVMDEDNIAFLAESLQRFLAL
ncbi:MAG: M28 family peptidase, partial [Oscillospiraceae bacterium]|nr:M28 family peptidase [Oscillospiraceae bacterium]